MLNFKKLIDRMTLEQKVDLIIRKDIHQNGSVPDLSIPGLFSYELDCQNNETMNIFFSSIFETNWDEQSIFELGKIIGWDALNKGSNLVFGPKLTMRSENEGFSSFAPLKVFNSFNSLAKGIDSLGVGFVLNSFANEIQNKNLTNIQKNEYYAKAFNDLIKGKYINAIKFERTSLTDPNYVKNELMNKYGYYGPVMIDAINKKDAFSRLKEGYDLIFIDDVDSARTEVINGVKKYYELFDKLKNNSIDEEEFNIEINNSQIISIDQIDLSVDKILTLVLKLSNNEEMNYSYDDLKLSQKINMAYLESIVLLKNKNNSLPLSNNNTKFICFGSIPDSLENSSLAQYVYQSVESQELLKDNENKKLEFKNLIYDNQLFIYFPSVLENQTELEEEYINYIKSNNKTVITVITDLSMLIKLNLNILDTIIYTPVGIDLLPFVLFGSFNPCGRLGISYSNEFSLGYGLSYSRINYSHFFVEEKKVSFTIENDSNYDTKELVQFYVSRYKGEKRLVDYKLVSLEKGESKIVSFDFNENTFATYNEDNDSFEVVNTNYEIAIATSENNIKFKRLVNPFDLTHYNEKENYKAEVENRRHSYERVGMEKSTPFISFGLKLTLLILTTLAAICGIGFSFINVDGNYKFIVLAFSVVIVIMLVIAYVVLFKTRKKYFVLAEDDLIASISELKCDNYDHELRKTAVVEKPTLEESKEEIEEKIEYVNPLDLEFEPEEIEEIEPEEVEEKEEIEDVLFKIDDSSFEQEITLKDVCQEFYNYAYSNGISIDNATIRSLFSALLSSKLIAVKYDDELLGQRVLKLFAGFLKSPEFYFHIDEKKKRLSDILTYNYSGTIKISKVFESLLCAIQQPTCSVFTIFENVNLEQLGFFKDFIPYINNPKGHNLLDVGAKFNQISSVRNGKMVMPKNLWFGFSLAPNTKLDLSNPLFEKIAVVDIIASKLDDYEKINNIKSISYSYILDIQKEISFEETEILPEELFKKLDRFAQEINDRIPFKLSSRLCNHIEQYSTSYVLCGGEDQEAMDQAVATLLLFALSNVEKLKKNDAQEGIASLVDKAFGVDNTAFSQRVLKK